ncbi:phosphate ABC transporter, permease protein PstA, partial [Enterococcus lactis]|nr:phosphate ABC transporter, permease protein PstA [Enterococcus lactis]
VLYVGSGIIVLILAALLLDILVRGILHISLSFLTVPSKTYHEGGAFGTQLFNSFYLRLITRIICFPISFVAGISLPNYAAITS